MTKEDQAELVTRLVADAASGKKSMATLVVALSAIVLIGCEGPAGPRGEQGPQGERGPQGEKGDQGAPGNLAIRTVTEACPQRCTLNCNADERVLTAYVVGNPRAPIFANEQSVEFNNRGVRRAGPAMVFCISK